MGLKDEIKQLIDEKKSEMESQKTEYINHQKNQNLRLEPIIPLLTEISDSIDLDCIGIHKREDSIDLDMGLLNNGYRSVDISWNIQPAFALNVPFVEKEENTENESESVFCELEGFDVWETIRSKDTFEEDVRITKSFDSEASLIEYLIENIATYVARHQK